MVVHYENLKIHLKHNHGRKFFKRKSYLRRKKAIFYLLDDTIFYSKFFIRDYK